MWRKLYRSLWDGSLRGKSDAQLVFIYLLANADWSGTAQVIPEKIADDTGLPLERVSSAISFLESPDDRSRSENEDGRRIVPIDKRGWGWRLVNFKSYLEMHDAEQLRERKAKNSRDYRLRASPSITARNRSSPQLDVDLEEDRDKEESTPAQRPENPVAASPVVLSFPLRDGSLYGVTEEQVIRWQKFYPEVNVPLTLREQIAWLESNPGRKKTRRGMPRFINAWLLKEQERPYEQVTAANGHTRR